MYCIQYKVLVSASKAVIIMRNDLISESDTVGIAVAIGRCRGNTVAVVKYRRALCVRGLRRVVPVDFDGRRERRLGQREQLVEQLEQTAVARAVVVVDEVHERSRSDH